MATSPADTATLGWQSLTTVVTARDTDIDPGIADMSTVEDRVAMLGMVARTHYESLIDLAPTGQPFESSYVWFCRIDEGANRGDSVAAGRPRAHAATRCDLRTILESITVHPDRTSITMTYNTATTRHALFSKIFRHDERRGPGGIPRWQPVTGC